MSGVQLGGRGSVGGESLWGPGTEDHGLWGCGVGASWGRFQQGEGAGLGESLSEEGVSQRSEPVGGGVSWARSQSQTGAFGGQEPGGGGQELWGGSQGLWGEGQGLQGGGQGLGAGDQRLWVGGWGLGAEDWGL